MIASSFFVQFRDYLVLKTSQIFRDVINPFPDRLEICAFGFIGGIGFILNVLMALSIYSRNSSKADKIKSFDFKIKHDLYAQDTSSKVAFDSRKLSPKVSHEVIPK